MKTEHRVVSRAEWIEERKRLLAKEKELTHLRDQVSQARRDLPWERVEKKYVFDGPKGERTLEQLFAGRSQLVVYHFMFDPSWKDACKSCSWWADNFERNVLHLAHRDVTLVAISRAPLEKLTGYAKRFGWTFDWYSAGRTDFNFDFDVSFDPSRGGQPTYNYQPKTSAMTELPGISVFFRDEDGTVFHTYSAYSRGLDMMNAGYHYLDLVPKGRDEATIGNMGWLRRRDEYEDAPARNA
jgi:predicted dithiol-disulfide oxidoreductase (DUF899 family)